MFGKGADDEGVRCARVLQADPEAAVEELPVGRPWGRGVGGGAWGGGKGAGREGGGGAGGVGLAGEEPGVGGV